MNIMAAVFFTTVMVGVCVGALVVSIKKPKSKKKCGPGKLLASGVVLDLVNKEVLKCEVPGQPNFGNLIPFESLYKHFHKAYGSMLDKFLK